MVWSELERRVQETEPRKGREGGRTALERSVQIGADSKIERSENKRS